MGFRRAMILLVLFEMGYVRGKCVRHRVRYSLV